MQNSIRKKVIQSLMLGGIAITAGLAATPASAATAITGPTFNFANANGNACTIRFAWGYTASTNDGGGQDVFEFAVRNNGVLVNGGNPGVNLLVSNTVAMPIGQTLTRPAESIILNTSLPAAAYQLVFYDSASAQTYTNAHSATVLPRAMMIAAGGACMSLVPNTLPSAAAPPDFSVAGGTGVQFGSSSIDPDGDPIVHTWTQVAGPSVTISGANTSSISFTTPQAVNHPQVLTFRVAVADPFGANPVTDDVTVTIPAGPNSLPVANAGADTIISGGTTNALIGSATDNDSDPLTYQWTQVSGPPVTITNPTSANASFVAPPNNGQLQTLTFQLIANDGFGDSSPDPVTFTIPANAPPTVSAGTDATFIGGSAVTLAGSATDPESDPLTYQWTQTGGTPVTLVGANTLTPSFTAPPKTSNNQVLTFSLTANDGTSASTPDTVDITIPGNVQPLPSAGADQTVNGGQTVTLTAAASSDPDGDTLTYQWVQVAGPTVTLTGANTRNPTFVAPAGGNANQTLTFSVTVSDPLTSGDPPTDLVDVVVLPNAPPVADAGPDQGPINTGSTVTLNGGASTDPDGNPLTYTWTQVSGPTVTLTNPTSASPTFIAPNVSGTQNLVFQLIVNDGAVDSAPDTVTVAVRAVGTVTVIQRVVGDDGSFSFISDITPLSAPILTVNGSGQLSASLVPAGSHTLSTADARAAGYIVTAIVCNDTDSVINLANRSVAIELAPGENLVCTFTSTNSRDAALTSISNFLTARNAAMLAHQPDLQRRLDRLNGTGSSGGNATAYGLPVPGSGRLPLSLNLAAGTVHVTSSLGMARAAAAGDRSANAFDIWTEASFASLNYNGLNGHFSVIYAGADYRLSKDMLVGGLVQFDRYSPSGARTAGSATGNGWMAGPYVTARIAPNFYADIRAAWGTSNNTIAPLGTYIDPFKTSRSLYSASLIGQFDIGGATQFRPEITVRHLGERQKAYLDSFGVAIPGQSVSQGELAFRPRLQHTVAAGEGWMLRPFIAADGIYTYGLERQSVFTEQFRMRVEGGAELFSSSSFRAGISAFHDGIGSDEFKSSGARVSVAFGF
ncbi:MAG: PKD domain-containing protein [Novosphingobium sp.]